MTVRPLKVKYRRQVVARRRRRWSSTSSVCRFSASLRRIRALTLAPSTIAVLTLGIGLVLDSNAWHFSQGLIVLAPALFAAAS